MTDCTIIPLHVVRGVRKAYIRVRLHTTQYIYEKLLDKNVCTVLSSTMLSNY